MNYKPLPSNPSSGKDSKLVSRLKGECWSLEQKEAIRNRFALITQKVFTYGCLTGRGDALSVKQEEYIDKGLWVDELMAELEAITKGEEQ